MNELKLSELHLPISPFLDNACNWYLSTHRNPYDDHSELYFRYKVWMNEQGVILRDMDEKVRTYLYFKDEQSMLLFALRWGN
jgi:hypothetical protein